MQHPIVTIGRNVFGLVFVRTGQVRPLGLLFTLDNIPGVCLNACRLSSMATLVE